MKNKEITFLSYLNTSSIHFDVSSFMNSSNNHDNPKYSKITKNKPEAWKRIWFQIRNMWINLRQGLDLAYCGQNDYGGQKYYEL